MRNSGDRQRRRSPLVAGALLTAVGLLAACTSSADPTPPPDPVSPSASSTADPADPAGHLAELTAPGPFATETATYRLADLELPGLDAPVEVEGDIVGPAAATGPLPIVLFLHGYQASCFRALDGSSTGDWPCTSGYTPIANRAGFTYLQERLASHGFVTVSIAANGVNVQATDMGDDAGAAERAALIHHHLDAWAAGQIPEVTQQWPEADAGSVMLVGHSRGGEGVDRAAVEAPDDAAWTIRGEVLMAPTEFDRPTTGAVPVLAFSGDCDGDIGPGAGQRYVDRPTADPGLLRSSILLLGANHNFFNTEWDPATSAIEQGYDDAFLESGEVDPNCDPKGSDRLTAAQQQDTAQRVLPVAAAAFLTDDSIAADALDGRIELPVGEATVHVAALGRGRTTAMMTTGYTAAGFGGVTAVRCRGVSETERKRDCGRGTGQGLSVHWPDAYLTSNPKDFVELSWGELGVTEPTQAGKGDEAELTLAGPWDLSAADGVEARIAVAGDSGPVALDLVLVDADGTSALLSTGEPLQVLPGGQLKPPRRWGLRLFAALPGEPGDPDRGGGVDLSRIVRIGLQPSAPGGHAWIIDVSQLPHR